MKPKILLTLLVLCSSLYSQSSLYMPIEFQNAYENKTRSYDGNPGEHYWQNFTSYTITAEIEPGTWKITGSENIVYTNNSPDSLTSIVIKTYPNHYKKGMPRANQVPLETLTDGMIISDLTINNTPVSIDNNTNVKQFGTYIQVKLSTPLLPGTSVVLEMNWTSEIPTIYVNRIGAYDENSAFVGYWYPQIARYDDIDGWDKIEYLGSHEFNTDFADFDVKLKVPMGYTIWATGDLQNPEEVLSEKEMEQFIKARTSREQVTVMPGSNSPIIVEGKETWHFTAPNVNDFAFGMSCTFKWISSTLNINGKEVVSNLVYDIKDNEKAERLLEVQEKSLQYLSNISPGITYPYKSFISFMGVTEYDGMEFPMIANNGFSHKESENTDVVFHELSHMYFPFLLGINEAKYSWMEEGWAVFFTIKFIQSYYAGREDENVELNRNLKSYNISAGAMWDVPLITPTFLLTYNASRTLLSYRKPAFMYFTLENMLGEETFQKCLKVYINRWSGKHPTPYDFMFTFNEASNQNLDWFWKAWIFDPGYGDLELTELDMSNSKLYIKNKGGLPLPITLKLTYMDGHEQLIERTASIWSQGDDSVDIDMEDIKNLASIQLITTHFPDADQTNNSLKINP